jgi:hypothetical protein
MTENIQSEIDMDIDAPSEEEEMPFIKNPHFALGLHERKTYANSRKRVYDPMREQYVSSKIVLGNLVSKGYLCILLRCHEG